MLKIRTEKISIKGNIVSTYGSSNTSNQASMISLFVSH